MQHHSTDVERVCQQCGKVFLAPLANVQRGFGKFCSRRCWHETRRISEVRQCAICGSVFALTSRTDKQRYCGPVCSGIARRQFAEIICRTCGKPFLARASEASAGRKKFCSKACLYAYARKTQIERFWSKVDRSCPDGCWPWTGAVGTDGYGKAYYNGRLIHAHRLAYELTYGPLGGPKILACHKCDVDYAQGDISYRLCCRPEHSYPGTHADNAGDTIRNGRGANQFGVYGSPVRHINPQSQGRESTEPCLSTVSFRSLD